MSSPQMVSGRVGSTLHESWIADSIISRGSANTTPGFLKYDSKDEAMVEFCCCCGGLDRVVDLASFVGRVVGYTELRTGATH